MLSSPYDNEEDGPPAITTPSSPSDESHVSTSHPVSFSNTRTPPTVVNWPNNEDPLRYILSITLWRYGAHHPVLHSLLYHGVTSLHTFMHIPLPEFDEFQVPQTDNDTLVPLTSAYVKYLKNLQRWLDILALENDIYSIPWWETNNLSRANFIVFSNDNPVDPHLHPPSSTNSNTPSPSARAPSTSYPGAGPFHPQPPALKDLTTDWMHGHKRDKSNYTELKSERDWDHFHHKLKIQAHADGIENLLDPLWTPTDEPARRLDHLHNKYFFSVLEHVLLTDRGKTIIRKYMDQGDFNARGVYTDLCRARTKLTKAKHKKTELLEFIVTSRT